MLGRLESAEREARCIRRAIFVMVFLLMVSVAGLGYCAILRPEVFEDPAHLARKGLSVLGLAALISQAVFSGYLFWHRAAVSRLHEECLRLILALTESRLVAPANPTPPAREGAGGSHPDRRFDQGATRPAVGGAWGGQGSGGRSLEVHAE